MSIANSIRAQIPPIHPEGYPFIGGFALVSLILFWIWTPLGWIGTLLTVWCALFFRDPVRVTPVREGIVVAPADGRVSMVTQVLPPAELGLGDKPLPRISIFMSVFNCHVNRSPVAGRIDRIAYRPGTFINAELDKASEDNERNSLVISTPERAHRRDPDRRAGGAADRFVRSRRPVDRRRRAVRVDPFRIAPRRLSARRHQIAGFRRPDRGGRARPFWPISGSVTAAEPTGPINHSGAGPPAGRRNGATASALAIWLVPCRCRFDPKYPEMRRRRFRPIPVRMLVPNVITLLAICAGLTAIRLSTEGRMELAVAAIVFAAVLDGLDGRVARMIKGQSKFGAELDSLADFVNFGVAPGLILYFWQLHELNNGGWIAAMVFAISGGLRLARFNATMDDPNKPAFAANYFTGVPAPAGAITVLLPIYLAFLGVPRPPAMLTAFYTLLIAFLMVSRLPVFSGKTVRMRVPPEMVLPVFVSVIFFIALLIGYPWYILSAGTVLYLLSLPAGWKSYRDHARKARRVGRRRRPDVAPANPAPIRRRRSPIRTRTIGRRG